MPMTGDVPQRRQMLQFQCYRLGRITSVSAMVFMEDSERAAKLSKDKQAWMVRRIASEFQPKLYSFSNVPLGKQSS